MCAIGCQYENQYGECRKPRRIACPCEDEPLEEVADVAEEVETEDV